MIRTFSAVALLLSSLGAPAMAGDQKTANSTGANAVSAHSAALAASANAKQIRQLLQGQGYTSVTQLVRSADGRWSGVATKNGERKIVTVALPKLGSQNSAEVAETGMIGAYAADLELAANAQQVRKLLQAQGYANVSQLVRSANGGWSGVATKNGERKMVTVALPRRALVSLAN